MINLILLKDYEQFKDVKAATVDVPNARHTTMGEIRVGDCTFKAYSRFEIECGMLDGRSDVNPKVIVYGEWAPNKGEYFAVAAASRDGAPEFIHVHDSKALANAIQRLIA